jgi:hypothetical protein
MIRTTLILSASAFLLLATAEAGAEERCDGAATIGSGGSAAAGGTSATTLGTGGVCAGEDGTSASIGSGGSAAANDGRADSRTRVNANENNLNAKSDAMAQDGGTWSKSKTQTKIRQGEELSSRTRTMSHVPGEKPVKSTTSVETSVPDATGSTATCDPAVSTCP